MATDLISRSCAGIFLGLQAIALGLPSGGCGGRAPRPSVVIVLVDQLRQDASERYLRQVRARAARGVILEEMRSVAPWTYPSVISLMSGLYPQQHGADARHSGTALSHFDPDVPLLQRTLKAAGYATAAFVTNPFLLEWNEFHRGFDTFDGSFIGSEGNQWGFTKAWTRPTMFADSVNEAVRRHYTGQPRSSPEFTYVHYIDVHGPWEGAPFSPGYDKAIRFVDGKIIELYEFFLERYGGDLIFIVTSDHGRARGDDVELGFGPRWRVSKSSVHDFNLRIPFLVLPGRPVPQGRRIPGPASSIDVVPTLLEWLGLEADAPLPGESLLAAIRAGEALDEDRAIYARNSGLGHWNDGLVHRGRKYIRHFDLETGAVSARRVFDLAADPRETRSVATDFGRVDSLLQEAAGDHGLRFEAQFRSLDAETVRQLRALGYFEAPPASHMAPAPTGQASAEGGS